MNRNWARWAEVLKAQADSGEQSEQPIESYAGPHGPVRAIRLTVTNVRDVSQWIKAQGGAVAGMRLITTGELGWRGIEIGDWLGGTLRFWIGDWVVEVAEGDFDRVRHETFEQNFTRH